MFRMTRAWCMLPSISKVLSWKLVMVVVVVIDGNQPAVPILARRVVSLLGKIGLRCRQSRVKIGDRFALSPEKAALDLNHQNIGTLRLHPFCMVCWAYRSLSSGDFTFSRSVGLWYQVIFASGACKIASSGQASARAFKYTRGYDPRAPACAEIRSEGALAKRSMTRVPQPSSTRVAAARNGRVQVELRSESPSNDLIAAAGEMIACR